MITSSTASQSARIARILDAGQKLVLRNGLRGTTMEQIAREAGVAKPTLYKYFPEKSALYETLMKRFVDEVRDSVDKALARTGTAESRIAAALTAKKKYTFRLLNASPHAHELYQNDPDMPMETAQAFERYFEDEITRILEGEGYEAPRYLAQVLLASAEGIAKRAEFAEQIGPAIRLITEKLLA